MNADRFDGPARNLCDARDPPVTPSQPVGGPQPPCQPANAELVEAVAVA